MKNELPLLDKLTNYKREMKHYLKRKVQKLSLKLFKLLRADVVVKNKYQMDAIKIFKSLLYNSDTLVLISPLSNKRYLKNDNKGLTIILDNNTVNIINHIYSYSVVLDDPNVTQIVNLFNQEVERRRNEFEKEITSNIKHSLKTILHKIENE
jgi:hypothetical protein